VVYRIATATMLLGDPLITARNAIALPVGAFSGSFTVNCQTTTVIVAKTRGAWR